MDLKEISETLTAAHEYTNRLKNLNRQLENAQDQVETSCEETVQNIEVMFTNLLNSITLILANRKKQLIQQTKKIHAQGVAPLKDCQSVILGALERTHEFIDLAERLSRNGNVKSLDEFQANASLLGSLPAVPDLKEVPYVSFQFDIVAKNDILKLCSDFGSVSQIAPVQISGLTENPGAILVEWECVTNDDRCNDIQEFCLQKAFGNVLLEKHLESNFNDCYRGNEIQCLVKDLIPNQDYSFRVCCKYESNSTWSPWSLVQVANTTITPYTWQPQATFVVTNDNRIAKATEDNPPFLLSDGPQYKSGFSIEFTFLECDDSYTFVGLAQNKNISKEENCFYVDCRGKVFVEGVEKATLLPEIKRGSKITFSCSDVTEEKVRVNVDLSDKRVTYDWNVCYENGFYFFAKFGSSKWKILVE